MIDVFTAFRIASLRLAISTRALVIVTTFDPITCHRELIRGEIIDISVLPSGTIRLLTSRGTIDLDNSVESDVMELKTGRVLYHHNMKEEQHVRINNG